MRAILGEGTYRSPKSVSIERALALIHEMKKVDKSDIFAEFGCEGELWARDALMWLIYGIWRHLGNRAHEEIFVELKGSWAGELYEMMRAHYSNLKGL